VINSRQVRSAARAAPVTTSSVGINRGRMEIIRPFTMLGSTAHRLAAGQARTAVVAVLTPAVRSSCRKAMRKQIWQPCERSLPTGNRASTWRRRLGDTAGSYILRLRAGQGVCREIDRSQSCVPMRSIAPRGSVHIGKMFQAQNSDHRISMIGVFGRFGSSSLILGYRVSRTPSSYF
jgi:hypothetical protein